VVGAAVVGAAVVGAAVVGAAVVGAAVVGALVVGSAGPQPARIKPITSNMSKGNRNNFFTFHLLYNRP